jgi:carbon-monoxide dehydrogenase medium subunit
MYNFSYQRPASLSDAVRMLSDDDEAMPLAGGMTLIPSMKHRLAAPSQLLDLSGLPELRGITVSDEALTIGAVTPHAVVAADADVMAKLPALASLAGEIGDPQVRARGTLGGSLANNDPAADYPAALLGLGGTVHTDRRDITADDFFVGMFETALEPGEIVCRVSFGIPRAASYAKFHHPASGYAMTGVFVARFANEVRVAVTGAAPVVFRWQQAEQALAESFDSAAVESLAMPADGLNADLHAPASYRAHLVNIMTRRAVAACGDK